MEPLKEPLRSFLVLIGTSRHSVVPLLRNRLQPVAKTVRDRTIALIAGSMLIGTAVALLVEADLGLAPYDVLADGLADQLGITLGQGAWLIAAVLFALAALLRKPPTLWGVGYILANGLAIDATSQLLNQAASTVAKIAFVVTAIVAMAAGVNLVLYSGTTGGPFELLMAAGEARGIKPLHVRYLLDIGVLVLGIVLGGKYGVATLIYAASMGIVLQVIRQAFLDYDAGRKARLAVERE